MLTFTAETISLLSALTQHKDFFNLEPVQNGAEGSPPQLPAHKQWSHCAAFDGTFTYLVSPKGVLKIGTGYGFTVPGHVYAHTTFEKELDHSFSCFVVCVAGNLLIASSSSPTELVQLSCEELTVATPLALPPGVKAPLLASERQYVHVLYEKDGKVLLDVLHLENTAKPVCSFTLDLDATVLSTSDVQFFANGTSAFIVTAATIDGSARSTISEFHVGAEGARTLAPLSTTEIDWDFSLVYDPFRDNFWQVRLEKKVLVLRSSFTSYNRTMPSARAATTIFHAPDTPKDGEAGATELSLRLASVLDQLAVTYITRECEEVFDFVPLCIDLVPSSLRELSSEIQKEVARKEKSLASMSWLTTLLHMLLASVEKLNRLTPCWIGAVPGFSALQPHQKSELCASLVLLLNVGEEGSFVDVFEHLADTVVEIFSMGFSYMCADSPSQLEMLRTLLSSSTVSPSRLTAVVLGALEQLARATESSSRLFYTSVSLQQSAEGAVPTSEYSLDVRNVEAFLELLQLETSSQEAMKRALLGFLQTCQRDMLSHISSCSRDTEDGIDLRAAFLDFSILVLRACDEELRGYCEGVQGEEAREGGSSLEDLYNGIVGQSMPLLLASLAQFDGSVKSRDLLVPLKETTKSLRQAVLATFSSDEIHLVGDKQWSSSPLCEVDQDDDALFFAHDSYGKKKKKKKAKDGELSDKADLGAGKYQRVLSFAPPLPSKDRLRRRKAMGFDSAHSIPWLLELESVMATTAGLIGHRIASATIRPESSGGSTDMKVWNEIQMHKYFRVPKDLTVRPDLSFYFSHSISFSLSHTPSLPLHLFFKAGVDTCTATQRCPVRVWRVLARLH